MADQYDSSDEARYRPVGLGELDALVQAGGRPVARDAGKLVHLLTRMRATLAANAETITGLHRHIEQQKGHLARVGQATTLNPLDALKYLDDTQRELLFDRISRDRLAMLRHMVTQAQNTREDLVGQLEQVRSAAAAMAQRADLPPDVRVEFTRLLSYLPSEVRDVHVPPLLDYPDLPPLDAAPAAGPPPPLRRRLSAPVNPAPDPGAGTAEAVPLSQAAVQDPPAIPVYRDPYAPAPVAAPHGAPHGAPDGAATALDGPAYVDPHAPAADAPAYRDPWAETPQDRTDASSTTEPPSRLDAADHATVHHNDVEQDDVEQDDVEHDRGASPEPPPPVRRDPRPPPDLDPLCGLFN